jgi:hypothetical protein
MGGFYLQNSVVTKRVFASSWRQGGQLQYGTRKNKTLGAFPTTVFVNLQQE